MSEEVTISTLLEAIAWGDEWERIAREQEREIHMLRSELGVLRAELRVYKQGYGIAMELAKPAPKFADAA